MYINRGGGSLLKPVIQNYYPCRFRLNFEVEGGTDTHIMTDWVISSDAAKNNILHQSLHDESNLTTFNYYVPAYKEFWISARVYGERLGVSEWSNPYHYNSKIQCEPM